MTWFLIILNYAGGEPAFIEMPNQVACEAAADATPTLTKAQTWCIPAGEWPEYDE